VTGSAARCPKRFFGAAEGLWHTGRGKILARRIGVQPLRPPQISHGGCHMVARNNGLSEGSDKPLFLLHIWLRGQDLLKTLQLPNTFEMSI